MQKKSPQRSHRRYLLFVLAIILTLAGLVTATQFVQAKKPAATFSHPPPVFFSGRERGECAGKRWRCFNNENLW